VIVDSSHGIAHTEDNQIEEEKIPMVETLKAWLLVLFILSAVVGGCLYGWPKYRGYVALEAAKTEIEISALKENAVAAKSQGKGKANHGN